MRPSGSVFATHSENSIHRAAIGCFDVFSLDKRTLIQQRNPFSLIREFVELLEEAAPGSSIGW